MGKLFSALFTSQICSWLQFGKLLKLEHVLLIHDFDGEICYPDAESTEKL